MSGRAWGCRVRRRGVPPPALRHARPARSRRSRGARRRAGSGRARWVRRSTSRECCARSGAMPAHHRPSLVSGPASRSQTSAPTGLGAGPRPCARSRPCSRRAMSSCPVGPATDLATHGDGQHHPGRDSSHRHRRSDRAPGPGPLLPVTARGHRTLPVRIASGAAQERGVASRSIATMTVRRQGRLRWALGGCSSRQRSPRAPLGHPCIEPAASAQGRLPRPSQRPDPLQVLGRLPPAPAARDQRPQALP